MTARAVPSSPSQRASLSWPVPVLVVVVSAGQQCQYWAQSCPGDLCQVCESCCFHTQSMVEGGNHHKPEFLPSSLKVLSALRKGSGQPLSCCPMTLKCFKQNRVDGGVLLRQLQGRGSQVRAATGGLGLGLGTGKTKADQHPAAPGLADRVSRRAAALGQNKQTRHRAAKTPGEQVGS